VSLTLPKEEPHGEHHPTGNESSGFGTQGNLTDAADGLLVGIDVAKAAAVAQIRLATPGSWNGRGLPMTTAGFTAFWRRLERHQRATGPGDRRALGAHRHLHQALAAFLVAQGADVVLVDNHVAHLKPPTLDRTWDKHDAKDAANLCDLLEQEVCSTRSSPNPSPPFGASSG